MYFQAPAAGEVGEINPTKNEASDSILPGALLSLKKLTLILPNPYGFGTFFAQRGIRGLSKVEPGRVERGGLVSLNDLW